MNELLINRFQYRLPPADSFADIAFTLIFIQLLMILILLIPGGVLEIRNCLKVAEHSFQEPMPNSP